VKKYLFIILLFVNISAQLDPQDYVDKAEKSSGNERIDLFNKAAESYRDLSQTTDAVQYAEKALTEAHSNEYTNGIIDAENILGNTYLLVQQLDEGLKHTRKALSLADANNYKSGIATSYRNIGIYLIYSNRPKPALDTLTIAANYFTELKDTTNLAATYTSLGVVNTRLNKIQNSFDLFKKAADLFISQGNNYQAAHAYLNLASIYSTITSDYDKGLKYGLMALDNFQLVRDDFKSAYARVIIGNIYDELGDYNKALDNYREALTIFENSGNTYLIINTINNIGEVYKHKQEYTKAIDFYIQALEKSKAADNIEGTAVALNNIGECYSAGEHYRLALDYYDQSYSILISLNDKHKMSISLNNQAAAYIELKNFRKAISEGKKAIEYAREVGSKEEAKDGFKNLYLAYKNTGNYEEALSNFIYYEDIKDSLLVQQSSDKLAKALAEQDAMQKEKEIELLTKNSELKEAQLDRQETLTYFLIVISFMLFIFGVVYYIRYAERKAMNKKLLKSEKELKELNKTKDLFFSIIAHDLKGPFNSLLGITEMLAEDIETFTDEEIENLSREVNSNARNVYLLLENLLEWSTTQLGSHAFDPSKFDLNEVVTQNINLYRKTASVKEINVNVDLGNDAFVYGDKNMIDSVMRNLLNNAIKFTQRAGMVNITTARENGFTLLTVKDNGVGISHDAINRIFSLDNNVKTLGTENEKGTGLGLILSKEFVDKNNGKIEVTSKEGEGTKFKITLPTPN